MSSSKPLADVVLADRSLRIQECPPDDRTFVPEYEREPAAPTAKVPRLPRSWLEFEQAVEERLAAFEQRHQQECQEHCERGVREGMRRRDAEVQKRLQAAAEPLQHLVSEVETLLARQQQDTYRQAARLASALATAWLGRMVCLNETVFLAALEDALAPLKHLDEITAHLHPSDYAVLKAGVASGDELFQAYSGLQIVADPEVEQGGVVTTSAGGSVDARIATRIERALEAIIVDNHD
jgi:flagellar biosynthesis/type III secretory pathway protein FliH